MERTDTELLRAARTDDAAFCTFYGRHAPALHTWFRRRAGTDAAADLTAEAFARVLVGLPRFRGRTDSSGAAWVYGIARNLLHEYGRTRRVETRAREHLRVEVRSYDGLDDVDDRLDARVVSGAFDSLPPDQRAAVRLRVIDELDYDEVAKRLDVAEPAARMRVSRALRALRTRVKGART